MRALSRRRDLATDLQVCVGFMDTLADVDAGVRHRVANSYLCAMNHPTIDAIINYFPFSPQLATGGQPTAAQLDALAAAGFEVVINLAMPTSTNALPNEAELVAAGGMDYIAIPVVWENPTLDDLARFCAAMDATAGRRVFVHCALNWRVSTFMYLYRMLKLGVPREEAVWDMLAIWEPDETWSAFIEQALAQALPS